MWEAVIVAAPAFVDEMTQVVRAKARANLSSLFTTRPDPTRPDQGRPLAYFLRKPLKKFKFILSVNRRVVLLKTDVVALDFARGG